MAVPDEFKNLKRRYEETRVEWDFLTAAISKLTSEYGYVSSDSFERLTLINKIKEAQESFNGKYEDLTYEVFHCQEQEDNKLNELANNSVTEIDLL